MTGPFKIESRSFFKRTNGTITAESNIAQRVMSISLPRVRFLEKDGEYKPAWAVEKEGLPPLTGEPVASNAKTAKAAKPAEDRRREKYGPRNRNPTEKSLTPFEKIVYEHHKQGKTIPEICAELKTTASTVTGALNRYIQKTLPS